MIMILTPLPYCSTLELDLRVLNGSGGKCAQLLDDFFAHLSTMDWRFAQVKFEQNLYCPISALFYSVEDGDPAVVTPVVLDGLLRLLAKRRETLPGLTSLHYADCTYV